LGVTVNCIVAPWFTVTLPDGLIEPPAPADAVTVKVVAANEAVTVQLAVTGAVVYVVPERVPPQPVTEEIL
jgi:hypothetical protein